jgi:hypothetical protein
VFHAFHAERCEPEFVPVAAAAEPVTVHVRGSSFFPPEVLPPGLAVLAVARLHSPAAGRDPRPEAALRLPALYEAGGGRMSVELPSLARLQALMPAPPAVPGKKPAAHKPHAGAVMLYINFVMRAAEAGEAEGSARVPLPPPLCAADVTAVIYAPAAIRASPVYCRAAGGMHIVRLLKLDQYQVACAHNYSLTQSLYHSITHSITHALTHALTHSLTHAITHSLTHSLTQLGAQWQRTRLPQQRG